MNIPRFPARTRARRGTASFHAWLPLALIAWAVLAAGPLSGAQSDAGCFCADHRLPSPMSRYFGANLAPLDLGNGVLVRDLQLHSFGTTAEPPLSGGSVWHRTPAQLGMEISFDAGASWTPWGARALTTFRWDLTGNSGGVEDYAGTIRIESEAGGGGGGAVRLRTRDSQPNQGSSTIRLAPGGYMVSSFFDIYIEVSTDGGGSYSAASGSCRLEGWIDHRPAAPLLAPSPLLPMPGDEFAMPEGTVVEFPAGIAIRGARHKLFSGSITPPPAGEGAATHHFQSQLDLEVSMAGGPFMPLRTPAATDVAVRRLTLGNAELHEAEITSLTADGGDLPPWVMIRESPTLRSSGLTGLEPDPGGHRVSSFFDIFLEVSTDGGQNWLPALRPARVQSRSIAPQAAYGSDLLPPPDGRHLSRPGEVAVFDGGRVLLRNLVQQGFNQSVSPPPPGVLGAPVWWEAPAKAEVSFDGGSMWMPVHGIASCLGIINSQQDHGPARHFTTETTAMNIPFNGGPVPLMIRESPTRVSSGRTSIRYGGPPLIDSFFDIYLEVSTDGGQNWWPSDSGPLTLTLQPVNPPALAIMCPPDIQVAATGSAGRVVEFEVTTNGGCAPVSVVCTPPSGNLFPVGTMLVSCTATDDLGQTATCSFTVTVTPYQPPPWFFADTLMPPPDGLFFNAADDMLLLPDGMALRGLRQRQFSESVAPPPTGDSVTHHFDSQVEFQLSMDGGATWQTCAAAAPATMVLDHVADNPGEAIHETEVTSWAASGGNLPPGVMIRESPTRASGGNTSVRPVPGGAMISSFFDIYIEVSTDGGGSWEPFPEPFEIQLCPDPARVPQSISLSRAYPPPDDHLVSTTEPALQTASGFVLQSISVRDSDASAPPPPQGVTSTRSFNTGCNLNWSFGGSTVIGKAPCGVGLRLRVAGSAPDELVECEVDQLDLTGGDLPFGVMIRESPTRASRGMLRLGGGGGGGGGGAVVQSFFDIFLEVSTDGGGTWEAPLGPPLRLESRPIDEPSSFAAASLTPPGGQYRSPAGARVAAGSNLVLRGVRERNFGATVPLPPPGQANSHTCGAWMDFEMSTNGGESFQAFSAPVTTTLAVADLAAEGEARYFHAEITRLDVAGGTLPAEVLIRESPTRASTSRAAVAPVPGGPFAIDSFFDIWVEISVDGGNTWTPSANGALPILLEPASAPPLLEITAPPDQAIIAQQPAGAVVNFPPPVVSGGQAPVTVSCNPPSGSLFPPGTTTVVCQASDSAGQIVTDTLQVVVWPDVDPPEAFFTEASLPPLGGMHFSTRQWFAAYPNGIVVRNVRARGFAPVFPAPPPGGTQFDTWTSFVELELSPDGGMTWLPMAAPALQTARVTGLLAGGGTLAYDTEMLEFSLSLPFGIMIREAPNSVSPGRATIRPVPGGHMISSFFDIFTEVSTDGGVTWWPALDPSVLESRTDDLPLPAVVTPSPLQPPPGERLVQAKGTVAVFPNGCKLTNLTANLHSSAQVLPPPGTWRSHTFSSQASFDLSMNNGASFTRCRAVMGSITGTTQTGSGSPIRHDTEMSAWSLSGGTMPGGVWIRESPVEPSNGGTVVETLPDGKWRVTSFFDIFLEISTDGGVSWWPSSNAPLRLEVAAGDPEEEYPTPMLPPPTGIHAAPAAGQWSYPNGVVVRDLILRRCTQSITPPPPGGAPVTHTYGAVVDMFVSTDGGGSFQAVTAPATVNQQVACFTDHGVTRFFDTEMLQLDIAGGGLPPTLMIRESPVLASRGRTSERMVPTGFMISSFFDVFTEVSTDGGLSWWPAAEPLTLALRLRTAREAWRERYFHTLLGAGDAHDLADPDHDRNRNIVEFATHTDPTRPNGSPGGAGASGGQLLFTYPRAREAVGDVGLFVEWSLDLTPGSWQTSGVSESVAPSGDDSFDWVTATIPSVPGGECFARLRVEP